MLRNLLHPSIHPLINSSIGVFNPLSLSPELLLESLDFSTFTFNAGNVSAWAGKSGNGYVAVQTTALKQPPYDATGLNGLPTINTPQSGSAESLEIVGGINIAEFQPRTLFMVVQPNTPAPVNGGIFGRDLDDMIDFGSSDGDNNIKLVSFAGEVEKNISSAAGSIPFGTPHIITVTDDGDDDMNCWSDGVQILTGVASMFDWDMSAFDLHIGWNGHGGGSEYNGKMSAFIAFGRVLTTVERLQMETYLTLMYGF